MNMCWYISMSSNRKWWQRISCFYYSSTFLEQLKWKVNWIKSQVAVKQPFLKNKNNKPPSYYSYFKCNCFYCVTKFNSNKYYKNATLGKMGLKTWTSWKGKKCFFEQNWHVLSPRLCLNWSSIENKMWQNG